MEDRYVRFHDRGQGRALIELAKQYPPKDAVREFVTNSLDARVPDTTEDISVMVNPSQRRVVISDNGAGMGYEDLVALPTSIGYSKKAGDIDMRGEKALGLLAFGSLGDVMQIISRPRGGDTSKYGYIRWKIDESKERIPFVCEQLDTREIERDFYGNFPHGTRVIIDRVDSHVMGKILTISNLKAWLRALYNPALRKGIAKIHLGRLSGGSRMRAESLEPINYEKENSSQLIDDIVPIQIKNEELPGDLEFLLFVDPEAAYDKVAVYSKDVLVYESLAELPEFSRSPVWTSGKVSGYINDYFNRLILGRAGIDRNRNAFKAWYSAIQEIEEKIRPIVEEKKKHGKGAKESGLIKTAFDALADVLRDIKKTELRGEYAISKGGELLPVEGAEPTRERKTGERKPTTLGGPTGRPPGPGTFRYSPKGHPQRVVPKSGVPFGYPQPIEFPASEANLRSKLEDLLGNPTLFLNSAHEDFISRADLKDGNVFIKYAIELIAKEIAYYEVRKAERDKRLVGDRDEIVNDALQKEETYKFLALKRLGIR